MCNNNNKNSFLLPCINRDNQQEVNQQISSSNQPVKVQKKAHTYEYLKNILEPKQQIIKSSDLDAQSLIGELNSTGEEVLDFLLKGVLQSLHKWNLSFNFTKRTVITKSQMFSLRKWIECLFFRLDLSASTFFAALYLINNIRNNNTWSRYTDRPRPTFELIFITCLILASKTNEDCVINRTNQQWAHKLRNTFNYFRNMHYKEYMLCMKILPKQTGLNLKALFKKISLTLISDTEIVLLKCLEWKAMVSISDLISLLFEVANEKQRLVF